MSEANARKGEVWIVTRWVNDAKGRLVQEYDQGKNPNGPWTTDPALAFEYTDSLSGCSARTWAHNRIFRGLYVKNNALPTRRSPP